MMELVVEYTKTLKKYLKIYRLFVKQSIAKMMAHRFDFLMSAIANFTWTIGQVISIQFILKKIGTFNSWSLKDLVLLLAFGQLFVYVSAVVYEINLKNLFQKIIDGVLDGVLLKPINAVFVLSFEYVSVPQILAMLLSVAPLAIYGLSGTTFSLVSLFFAGILWILGFVSLYFLSLIILSLSFHMVESFYMRQVVVMSAADFSKIPLFIFPKPIQNLFTFIIPVAFVAYLPVLSIKGKIFTPEWILIGLIVVVVLYFISKKAWEIGYKKYSGMS